MGKAAGFLRYGTAIGKSTGLPEGVERAVSSTMRNLSRALPAFGTESALADFFGHPFADGYFSQAPMRYSDDLAKLGAVPKTDSRRAPSGWRLDPRFGDAGPLAGVSGVERVPIGKTASPPMP